MGLPAHLDIFARRLGERLLPWLVQRPSLWTARGKLLALGLTHKYDQALPEQLRLVQLPSLVAVLAVLTHLEQERQAMRVVHIVGRLEGLVCQ